MPWLQLHVVSPRENADTLEALMLEAGACSVTMTDDADNPILEPGVGEMPLWETVRISGLFPLDADRKSVTDKLSLPSEGVEWETLEDKTWERAWMDQFHPICCGDRLWICPSWQSPPDPQATNIILDPGLAFGSGTHPTTFLCLQCLDRQELANKTVVDYGCGSGILGIAALLLGARSVIAIDNDPQALFATRENLQRNGLESTLLETYLPEQVPDLVADLVMANILASPLIELASTIDKLLIPGGNIVLSGIMSHQIDAVRAAYPSIEFAPPTIIEEWVRLDGTKSG